MKVIYTDPDGREGTFHPHLGWLESGKEFEMYNDDEAKKYVDSGLLKKVERTVPKSENKNSEPGTRNSEPKNKEVKKDGNSTDR